MNTSPDLSKKWKMAARIPLPSSLGKHMDYINDFVVDESGNIVILARWHDGEDFLIKISLDGNKAKLLWRVNAHSLYTFSGYENCFMNSLGMDSLGFIYSAVFACDSVKPLRIGILKLDENGRECDYYDNITMSFLGNKAALSRFRINSRGDIIYLINEPESVIGVYNIHERAFRSMQCSRLEHYMKKMSRVSMDIDDDDNIYVAVNNPEPAILKYNREGSLLIDNELERICRGKLPEIPLINSPDDDEKIDYGAVHICHSEIADLLCMKHNESLLALRPGFVEIISTEDFSSERILLGRRYRYKSPVIRSGKSGTIYLLEKGFSLKNLPALRDITPRKNPRIVIYDPSTASSSS
jgi:hypothetical protein